MNLTMKVDKVNKSIDGKHILKDISFELYNGKITALLGPNGSGKTTTLKVISGLISADSGKIIANKDDIMLVFDEPILYEELTGIEHIKFIRDLQGINISDNDLEKYIKTFQLTDFINNLICTYSLGTKKKLQLLCSLLKKPKILLLDEYISGLDPITLYNVKEILKHYAALGNSILLSTHMLDVAEKFCDDIIMIQDGRIIGNKSVDMKKIVEKYSSLEEFFIKTVN